MENTINPPSIYGADHYKSPLWSNMNEIFYPQDNYKVDGKNNV